MGKITEEIILSILRLHVGMGKREIERKVGVAPGNRTVRNLLVHLGEKKFVKPSDRTARGYRLTKSGARKRAEYEKEVSLC